MTRSASNPPPSRARPALAIACLAASIFLLEVLLTRIFSVILYHHFAFVAVSTGMLGLATAGVRVALSPERFLPENAMRDAGRAALAYGAATLVVVSALTQVGLSPNYTWLRALAIPLVYAVTAVPFYFGGLAITLILTHHRHQFARLYAIDLASAGVSALAVAPLLVLLGGPSAAIVAALLAASAAFVAFGEQGEKQSEQRRRAWLLLGAAAVLIVADQSAGLLRLRRPKEASQGAVLYEAWNALSRVAVYDQPMQPWAVAPRYTGPLPSGLQMDIDASAATPILSAAGGPSADYLRYELTAAAYSVAKAERALVIGAGGGRDVLSALLLGAGHVDAVEINPIIVNDVMRGRFRDASAGVYVDPRVTVHVEDGRTFVRRSPERYDVVQLSLVDTWAATAAGAFALSENNLYTLEAVTEYIEHLQDDGVLTVVRWSGSEVPRLLVMMDAAAKRAGIEEPARHLVVLETPHTPLPHVRVSNVILRRSPWTAESLAALEHHVTDSGFTWVHHPLRVVPGRPSEIARAADPLAEAARTETSELRPSTDDWPFFFYRPRPSFFGGIAEDSRRLYSEGQYVLAEILVFATIAAFTCLLLPFFRRGRRALRAQPLEATRAGLYFASIGVGFMFLEMSMMQRFVLYLGHPTYALTSVIVGLLVGAGIGSALAGKVRGERRAFPVAALAGVLATTAIGVSGVLQPAFLAATQHLGFAAKVALTEALVLPLGATLGALMPLGIAHLTERSPALVPWAWSVNGFASVVGSCIGALLSMSVGFSTTYMLAAACYLAATVVAVVSFRRMPLAGSGQPATVAPDVAA
jgi:hypothetical protein